jgi:hypothetical protein
LQAELIFENKGRLHTLRVKSFHPRERRKMKVNIEIGIALIRPWEEQR